MADRPAFGRRGTQPPPPKRRLVAAPAAPAPAFVRAEGPAPAVVAHPEAPLSDAPPSVEAELEEWKRSRKRAIPWRPLYLMASLCFGLAYFVLPDSVNSAVQWPLYGLAAMSFYVGVRRRRERKSAG